MFVEESIHEGMQWMAHETNKEGEKLPNAELSLRPCAAMPLYPFTSRIFLIDLAILPAVAYPGTPE